MAFIAAEESTRAEVLAINIWTVKFQAAMHDLFEYIQCLPLCRRMITVCFLRNDHGDF